MTAKNEPISEDDVNDAQREWCTRLVETSRAYPNGNYRQLAIDFIDDLYDFEEGKVFFRPTLAMAPRNFRTTREGALAYFIGEDPRNFPDDKGFIKLGWLSAHHDNLIEGKEAIQIHENIAIAMGNVYLWNEEMAIPGRETVVDKVFVYRRDDEGKLRLIVHNSAVSNLPPTEKPED
jgi:hypothetical protein